MVNFLSQGALQNFSVVKIILFAFLCDVVSLLLFVKVFSITRLEKQSFMLSPSYSVVLALTFAFNTLTY